MSSYLQSIRRRVGHAKILLVYATACVCDGTGRLLWQRRADFGWWGLPGGVLELDESLPQCVVREAYEETGLVVEPVRVVGIYSSPDFDVTYPNGDQVQQVTVAFECQLSEPSRPDIEDAGSASTETLAVAWFPPDEPPPTAPWYAAMAADLIAARPEATFDRGSPGDQRPGGESFIQTMRRRVGLDPFVTPAAVAFVQDEAGHVLLQRRADNGAWGLPGGGMELGERVDRTAANETREETGLEVEPVRLVGVYSDEDFWVSFSRGDQLKVVSFCFACRMRGGEPQADGVESSEVGFFPPDALPPLQDRTLRHIRDGLEHCREAIF